MKHLAELAGVHVRWVYHKTTIDPPELVRFIRANHPDVKFNRPEHGNFFNRMVKKGFPTRKVRWCCQEYKERNYPHETLIMGIRGEESVSRSKRYGLVSSWRKNEKIVCPIYHWPADKLWRFIRDASIPYPTLYDEGFKRLGCIGCPMSRRGRIRQFERWPVFEKKWKRAFHRIWEHRTTEKPQQRDGREWFGTRFFNGPDEMWQWWLYDRPLPCPDQLELPKTIILPA